MDFLRGIVGILFLLGIAYLFSENKKKINWSLVIKALLIQIVLAVLILKVPFVEGIFDWLGRAFAKISVMSVEGAKMIFGDVLSHESFNEIASTHKGEPSTGKFVRYGGVFAFRVLPTILFFSALVSLLYYWGILQKVVYGFAWVMKKAMKISGAESLAAAGNIFLGQTESPLLVKPYLGKMTKSELMSLMTGGMATIAGSVLAAFIGFIGTDMAKHLLCASIMSAPAAILCAKILVPETEEFSDSMELNSGSKPVNALEAIVNGTGDGLRLAVNVAAMLLVFVALIATLNFGLGKLGSITGLNEIISANTNYNVLSFQAIAGYIFAPIAWMIGVASEDMILVGQLLGEKTILNEFIAYITYGEMKAEGSFVSEKSMVMCTYMLCGFANFSSIGIQIGGIGALAPTRKGMLSKLGVKSLIGGTLACLFTAAIVGMLY